jgi:hypothetical protein
MKGKIMERQSKHCRFFQIGGVSVVVESDLDLDTIAFKPELLAFALESPGDDQVRLRHYFKLPDLRHQDLGKELYHEDPWAISRKEDKWYYRTLPLGGRVAIFNASHTRATIYNPPNTVKRLRVQGWHSLSLFSTDQVWLAHVLADRNAVLLHSAAAILNGKGLLFVGHSDAGKSTTLELLRDAARSDGHPFMQVEILCDDRNIVRRWKEGWRVHGTWSHGTVSDLSPNSAPLRAIFFLEKHNYNEITPLKERKEIWKYLLGTLIRPMMTAEWWQKELSVLEQIVNEVPCYIMRFDKSGEIVDQLVSL